jgi:hypothetical protein
MVSIKQATRKLKKQYYQKNRESFAVTSCREKVAEKKFAVTSF